MADHRADAIARVRSLGEHVRPVSLARERVLPVLPALGDLLPEGGVRRGSVVACTGAAPLSGALALAAAASQAGSWVGIVGLPTLGLVAAAEWGLALERLVRVAEPPRPQLATVLAALSDGVDVVIADTRSVSAGDARRLTARLGQRGGVLVAVGDPGGFSADFTCGVHTVRWIGLGEGVGCLTGRRVSIDIAGRRAERPRHKECWFPLPQDAVDDAALTTLRPVAAMARAG